MYKPLETAVLKTIAAFLNSRDGGTLLIGVADDGTVHGLDSDYSRCARTAGTIATSSSWPWCRRSSTRSVPRQPPM